MKTNTNLLITARIILWPAAALSAWGNVELFGGSQLLSQSIVLVAACGLELGMMTLISLGARDRALRVPALAVGAFLLALSLLGQYAFLLSRATGHEESVHHAAHAEQSAQADQAAIRGELETVQAALARENASGWGPKAKSLAERADALRAKLDALNATASTAAETQAHRSPMLVLTERFRLDADLSMKLAPGLFLVGVNVAGFLLLYAASAGTRPAPAPMMEPEEESHPVPQPRRCGASLQFARAPQAPWLEATRRNQRRACAPKPLDIKLGNRTALS